MMKEDNHQASVNKSDYIKHVVECKCILPQYRTADPPVFHKFLVFSEILEDGSFKDSYAQCNNCGVIHRVIEVSRSRILKKEDMPALLGEEDYRVYLGKRLYNLFTSANKTSNIQVERKLEYTDTDQDTGERELKSLVIKTNLTGNLFDSDEYRKKDISIDTPGKNKKLKLHTVEGQLGGLTEIKSDRLVKDTDASLGTPSGSVLT